MQQILLVRHGATKGNTEKRYVGSTDEPLLPESRTELAMLRGRLQERGFAAGLVYISPLRRCRESAELLFPDVRTVVVPDFRECAFGAFEYRNYAELNGDPAYQRYIDSGGTCGFPGGETKAAFSKRVCDAFASLRIDGDTALVVHGGTVMAILDAYAEPRGGYFSWQLSCGEAYLGSWDGKRFLSVNKLT